MNKAFKKEIFSEEQIQDAICKMSSELNMDFKNSNNEITLIGVLKGCQPFFSDLSKKLDFNFYIEYVEASTWNKNTEEVKLTKEFDSKITGKDIIIVETVIDSGITLQKIIDFINKKNPRSLKILTLLDKPSSRDPKINIDIDYCGLVAPDEFLIGYGMDYKDIYRNISSIGIIKDELI